MLGNILLKDVDFLPQKSGFEGKVYESWRTKIGPFYEVLVRSFEAFLCGCDRWANGYSCYWVPISSLVQKVDKINKQCMFFFDFMAWRGQGFQGLTLGHSIVTGWGGQAGHLVHRARRRRRRGRNKVGLARWSDFSCQKFGPSRSYPWSATVVRSSLWKKTSEEIKFPNGFFPDVVWFSSRISMKTPGFFD